MKTITISILISLFIILFISCNKKNSLVGVVIDANNSIPILGVDIKINNHQIKSGNGGVFNISDTPINKEVLLRLHHPDFVQITRRIKLETNGKADTIVFHMLKRGQKAQYTSNDPIQIEIGNTNGKVIFAPNTWRKLGDNTLYTGKVNIQLTYFDPKDWKAMEASSAPLIGINNKNEMFPLKSFGMVEIYATDQENNRLDISPEKPVEILFPAFTNVENNVGLYTINNDGYWVEKETLTLDTINLTLKGSASSISEVWNADVPCAASLICVSFHIVDANLNPIFKCISYRGVSYQSSSQIACSDNLGFIELYVCPGEVFEIYDIIPCCDPGDIPGTPAYQFCCVQGGKVVYQTVDLSTVTLTPPCTDLGTLQI